MIEVISNQAKKMMFDCCNRYAKLKSIHLSSVQLLLGLDENGNTYKVCEDYQPKISYDIMGVLGVKIDFLGYSQIAPPFILKSLVRLSHQYGIDLKEVSVMCIPEIEYYEKNGKQKERNEIQMFLFNGGTCVETKYTKEIEDEKGNVIRTEERNGISFEQLFNQEDIEFPT